MERVFIKFKITDDASKLLNLANIESVKASSAVTCVITTTGGGIHYVQHNYDNVMKLISSYATIVSAQEN